MAWTASQKGITAPIIGATSVDHVDQAVAALAVKLDGDDCAVIDAAYQPRAINASGH